MPWGLETSIQPEAMAYLKESELRDSEFKQTVKEAFRKGWREAVFKKTGQKRTVFLSHSHNDKGLVQQAEKWLEYFGVNLYIDWKDPEMPISPTEESVKRLLNKVEECQKFIYLHSHESVNSNWVPWEIGLANGYGSIRDVAVFPLADDTRHWNEPEYLYVYPKIEVEDKQLKLTNVGMNDKISFQRWVSN